MGSEPMGFVADPVQTGQVERAFVSGEEVRRRVQELIDADPVLGSCEKKVHAPMPKPTSGLSPTGCNWHMHYRGQFPDCEERIDAIVEIVQNDLNIGGPVSNYLQ